MNQTLELCANVFWMLESEGHAQMPVGTDILVIVAIKSQRKKKHIELLTIPESFKCFIEIILMGSHVCKWIDYCFE